MDANANEEVNLLELLGKHWGLVFVENAEDEYTSSCPQCGDGGKGSESDRFHLWLEGVPRYWCRKCGWRGKVSDLGLVEGLSEEALRKVQTEAAERRAREYQESHRFMLECGDHLEYHRRLLGDSRLIRLWTDAGMNMETIHHFRLGYCDECPMDKEHRPSLTIPVIVGGKLFDIQHRILGARNGDKYRPHRKGLGVHLFNVDCVQDFRWGVLVEGAKKTMAAVQHGISGCVGTYGASSLQDSLLGLLSPWDPVYVLYDPDAVNQAEDAARAIGEKARVVDLYDKLDDFLYGEGNREDVLQALRFSRRVK